MVNLKKKRSSVENVGLEVERYPLIVVAVGDGGTGKTPIAYMVGGFTYALVLTNDGGILDGMAHVGCHRGFREMELESINNDLDLDEVLAEMPVVIDMGGYGDSGAIELFKKADLVICPIKVTDNSWGIERAYESIEAIAEYASKISVIQTFSKSTLAKNEDFTEIKKRLKTLNIDSFFEIKKTNVFNNALSKKIGVTDLWRGDNALRAGTYGYKKGMKTENIKSQIEKIENYIKEI